MRDKIIESLNRLVWVLAAIIVIGAVGVGLFTMATTSVLGGIGIIIAGCIYAIIVCGMIFVFLDIRDNTRRTAEAVEALTKR